MPGSGVMTKALMYLLVKACNPDQSQPLNEHGGSVPAVPICWHQICHTDTTAGNEASSQHRHFNINHFALQCYVPQ